MFREQFKYGEEHHTLAGKPAAPFGILLAHGSCLLYR